MSLSRVIAVCAFFISWWILTIAWSAFRGLMLPLKDRTPAQKAAINEMAYYGVVLSLLAFGIAVANIF